MAPAFLGANEGSQMSTRVVLIAGVLTAIGPA
jgi:hypothetical protein